MIADASCRLQEILEEYKYTRFITMFLNDGSFALELDELMAQGSVQGIEEECFNKLFGRYDDRDRKGLALSEAFYNHYIKDGNDKPYFKKMDNKYRELLSLLYLTCSKQMDEIDNLVWDESIPEDIRSKQLKRLGEHINRRKSLKEVQKELRTIAKETPVYGRDKKDWDSNLKSIYERLNLKEILTYYKIGLDSVLIPRPIISDWIYLLFMQSIAGGKGYFRSCKSTKKNIYGRAVVCGKYFHTKDSRVKFHCFKGHKK